MIEQGDALSSLFTGDGSTPPPESVSDALSALTAAEAHPAGGENPPDGENPPPRDALSALLETNDGAEGENDATAQLRMQCDMSASDRRLNIRQRLNSTEDPATDLGIRLLQAVRQPESFDAQLIEEIRTAGATEIADSLHELQDLGELNRASVIGCLARWNDHFGGENGGLRASIFDELKFDGKTPEEGARRQRGETAMVLARSGLLAAGVADLTEGRIAEGSEDIHRARCQSEDFPDWFIDGFEASLRNINVAEMGEDQIPTLEAFYGNLYYRFNMITDRMNAAKQAEDPTTLHGLEYVYRKCIDAQQRHETIKQEIAARELKQQHDREYEGYARSAFNQQVEETRKAALENLNGDYNWRSPINLDQGGTGSTFGRMIRFEEGWKFYCDNNRTVAGVRTLLRKLDEPRFLKRIAVAFSTKNGPNDEYCDGSYTDLGLFHKMEPQAAQAAAAVKAERYIFATGLGLVEAHFLHVPKTESPGALKDQQLETVTDVLAIVGKGHALDLIKAATPEAQAQFTDIQLQFRQELLAFLTKMQGEKAETGKSLGMALVEGARRADVRVAQENAEREKVEQAAHEKFAQLENSGRTARSEVARHMPEVPARLSEANSILTNLADIVPAYLIVEGEGADRTLRLATDKLREIQAESRRVTTQLEQETDPKTRDTLSAQQARLEVQLAFCNALNTGVNNLNQNSSFRFSATEGLVINRKTYGCYDIMQLDQVGFPTTELQTIPYEQQSMAGELAANEDTKSGTLLGRCAQLESDIQQLRTGDVVENTAQIETALTQADAIMQRAQELDESSRKLVTHAVQAAVNHALSRYGIVFNLSQAKGSPFYRIFGYNNKK